MSAEGQAMIGTHIRVAQVVLPSADLAADLNFFVEKLGFKVNLIVPADAPATAVISGHGLMLRLEKGMPAQSPLVLRLLCDLAALPAGTSDELTAPGGTKIQLVDAHVPVAIPQGRQEFVLTRGGNDAWGVGRAGMQYRDLIPSRLGGRFVASHIRIPDGGPVPDYVHFHKVRFQMIFCKSGWAKLVYEDQGEPFLLRAGDCVLQPPEIRHRVLEASPGLEVIEIGCPAIHETFADHNMSLPTGRVLPDRLYGSQRFVRHIAEQASWLPWRLAGFEARDTGIAAATDGLAAARVVRSRGDARAGAQAHGGEFLFLFVLQGSLGLDGDKLGHHQLQAGDSVTIPAGAAYALSTGPALEMLEVSLPAVLPGHISTAFLP